LDVFLIAAAAAAFFCGGLVKGVVGIGLPLTSIALLTLFLDLRLAIPLLVVPILATNVVQAFRGGRFVELLLRYWLMLAGGAVGVWLGVAALYRIELSYLEIALGIVVCGYSLINLLSVRLSVSEASKPVLSPFVGVFSGVLAGTTGSIGLPVAIYFQALGLAKDVFVQAIGIQFLITGSFLAIALAGERGLNAETLPASVLALVPAFAGMWAGQMVRDRVSEDRFRTWLFVLLLVIGLNLIRKGVF
jgi:uncharacterized membrane protein YfcA